MEKASMQHSQTINRDVPGAPSQPATPAPALTDVADIDLERALWDLDYRAQALETLRRARENGGT